MQLDTIGKNIRKYRLMKKFRQEDLAEKAGLTTNYIGMVERGEKIPSLETFIKILNALETSLDKGTQRKTSENELPSLTQCTA